MILHANAIAQNRSASVGTGGVDGDNADGTIIFAIEAGQLIDQRALARSGRPRQPKHTGFPAVWEQSFSNSDHPGAWFSTVDIARESARTSPERICSIQSLVS